MIGAHHAYVPFIIKRTAVKLIGRGGGDKRYVNSALLKLADKATGGNGHHAHAYARRLCFKGGDKRHNNRPKCIIRSGKSEGEASGIWVKGNGLKQHVDIRENALHRSGQRFRARGWHHAVRGADKERIVEVVPQAVEHAAHGGLGQSKTRRRAGDAAFIQQSVKRFQQV